MRLDDIDIASSHSLLDKADVARADAMTSMDARDTFIRSRSLLRAVLARETGIAAHRLRFRYGPFGKPRLVEPSNLHFNLTHSRGMALVAVHSRPLGIDIEFVDPAVAHRDLADFLFTEAEREQIRGASCHDHERRRFFRIWTRKEAVLKAIGTGFSSDAVIDVAEGQQPNGPDLVSGWQLLRLPMPSEFEAAVAVEASCPVRISRVLSISPLTLALMESTAAEP